MNVNREHSEDVSYFVAFCIEIYKTAANVAGGMAARIFKETGLTDFLIDNFEPIHSQSPQWILEEINEYLSTHK